MKKILLFAVSIIAFLLTSCATGAALVGKSTGISQEVWLYRNPNSFSNWTDIKWTNGTSYTDLFGGGSIKVLAPLPSEMVTIWFSAPLLFSATVARSSSALSSDKGTKEVWESFEWKFPQLVGKEKWVKGYESQLENSPDIQKKFSELKAKYKDVSKYDYVVEVQFDANDIEFKKNETTDYHYKEIWYEAYIPEGKVKNIKVYEWSLPNEVPVILNGKEVAKRKISSNSSGASFDCTKMKDVIEGFKFSGYTGEAVPILPLQVTRVGDHYSCEGYEFWCDSDNLVQGGHIQTKVTYEYASIFSKERSWLKTFFCFEFDEKSGTYRLELHRGAVD